MAAGIAYWALFSLFPLALVAVSIMGFIYPGPDEQRQLVEGIVKIAPVSADYLADLVKEVAGARGPLGGLAVVGLVLTGTAVFSAVRKGINHAWGIGRPHYFLLERAIDVVMLLGVAALAFVILSLGTNMFGLATLSAPLVWLDGGLIGKALLESLVLAITFGVFLLLYRFVPNTKVAWRDVWPGALLGAVLFYGVRAGFTWYVSSFGRFNLVYGSLGALMAVLLWAYLSSVALLWGAQVAATYSRLYGTGAKPGNIAELNVKVAQTSAGQRGHRVLSTVGRWLLPPRRSEP